MPFPSLLNGPSIEYYRRTFSLCRTRPWPALLGLGRPNLTWRTQSRDERQAMKDGKKDTVSPEELSKIGEGVYGGLGRRSKLEFGNLQSHV